MADEGKSKVEAEAEQQAAGLGTKTAGQNRADILAKEKFTDVTPLAAAAAKAKAKREAAAKAQPSPAPSPRADSSKEQGSRR